MTPGKLFDKTHFSPTVINKKSMLANAYINIVFGLIWNQIYRLQDYFSPYRFSVDSNPGEFSPIKRGSKR